MSKTFANEWPGIVLILLFHAVGLAGFSSAKWAPLFEQIVPLHLLLMLGVVIWYHRPKNKAFFITLFLLMLAGWSVEWLGVRTGKIFGHYQYGSTLGFKADGIPLMIGVNWFLLVYSVTALVQKIPGKNRWFRIFIGALMLVLLDVFIEPIAIKFHYWSWASHIPPLQNYIGWFVVSFVFLQAYALAGQKPGRYIGPALYITQLLFFAVLGLGGKIGS
ncbi:MAG: carotenoid biosynthesis protein [Mucilaginibacter polytrichastri]|nr:carotenoid biosynthesis protein [Mucilaginibacter polytrichastri]